MVRGLMIKLATTPPRRMSPLGNIKMKRLNKITKCLHSFKNAPLKQIGSIKIFKYLYSFNTDFKMIKNDIKEL